MQPQPPDLSRHCVLAALLTASLALAPSASGQDRVSLAPAPTGTFEFRVLGPDNQPLVDITPAEVSLKVNGRLREIRALQLYRSDPAPGGVAPAARAAATVMHPPDPFGSNYPSGPGREVLIVIDDDSFASGRERSLKPAVANLLAMLNANDRAGVLGIPAGNPNIASTRQRDAIETALAAMVGLGTRTTETSDRYCRALIALSALQGVFERYAGATYATIVFFSGGMVAPNTEIRTRLGEPGETCELRAKHFQDLGFLAQKMPIDVHVAYIPEDTSGGSAASNEMQAGLESVAGVTGNPIIRLAGESDRLMAGLVDETSAYYAATFDIDPAERNGSPYRAEVKVSRDGAKAHARQFVTFGRQGSARKGPSLKEMVRVAGGERELPLRAAGFAAREAGSDKLKVVALVEPRDRTTTLAEATVALFDSAGKLTAQWTADAATLRRSPAVAGLLVKPGTYRMRVAAIDADGRRGTVDQAVTVALEPAGTSALSALLLGSRTPEGFVPRLLYGRDDAMAVGYVELYSVPGGAPVGGAIELAASADGPALVTGTIGMTAASQADMRVLMGSVPISALPPGDYVLRITVRVGDQPAGRVLRTLRKAAQ